MAFLWGATRGKELNKQKRMRLAEGNDCEEESGGKVLYRKKRIFVLEELLIMR